ncbi:MAG: DUF47 domain-containing protein [Mycobacteriales bacterium]
MRLTPVDSVFYEMFVAAADNVAEATEAFLDLVPTSGDRRAVAGRIRELEHLGDELTHSLIRRLNATFLPPFDATDVYRLAGCIDDALDFVEEAADRLLLYSVAELPDELAELALVLVRAGQVTAAGLRGLQRRRGLEEYWITMGELEKRADLAYRRFIAGLFSSDRDALTVMRLKAVGEAMESAADAFEHIANTVETIAVKEL